MTREELMALADELESMDAREGCRTCPADGTKDCRGDLSCEEAVARAVARRVREIVEHDEGEVMTVSAYDLLSDDDRDALAWVREHGGLAEVEKRLMPDGVEWLLEVWPRWSNGEYCKFGDWWMSDKYGDSEPKQFLRLSIYTPEQLDEWGQGDWESYGYEWGFVRPSDPKYRPDKVEPPAPKVLDADGVEIRVGDTVWRVGNGVEFTVIGLPRSGEYQAVKLRLDDGAVTGLDPDQLTHQRPVLDADGVEIRVGDVLYSIETGDSVTVDSIEPGNPWFATTDGALQHCAKFTHRAPVLAADGKPLREGETVWHVNGGGPYIVTDINRDTEHIGVTCNMPDGKLNWGFPASELRHEQPDDWSRWREDLELSPAEYADRYRVGRFGHEELDTYRDLVRRARKLAERGA